MNRPCRIDRLAKDSTISQFHFGFNFRLDGDALSDSSRLRFDMQVRLSIAALCNVKVIYLRVRDSIARCFALLPTRATNTLLSLLHNRDSHDRDRRVSARCDEKYRAKVPAPGVPLPGTRNQSKRETIAIIRAEELAIRHNWRQSSSKSTSIHERTILESRRASERISSQGLRSSITSNSNCIPIRLVT